MLPHPRPLEYPYYSEEPVTESDWHYLAGAYLRTVLGQRYRERPDVYVASNLFVYWQEGDLESKVSPDVFVCFGVEDRQRKTYLIWEEGKGPDVVFEITSQSSRVSDQGTKRAIYAMLGVQEYFLFDPLGEYLPRQLRGYRREGDELLPLAGADGLLSQVLGVELRVEDRLLRLVDASTGEVLLTYEELAHRRLEAEEALHNAELALRNAERALHDKELALQNKDLALHDKEEALRQERERVAELERRLRES